MTSASDCDRRSQGKSSPEKDGDFYESMRALREILTLDTPTMNLLKGDQYEHFRSEIKALKIDVQKEQAEVQRLRDQVEQAQYDNEAQRNLRSTLEGAYDALNKHKEVLVEQANGLNNEIRGVHKELQATKDTAFFVQERLESELDNLRMKLAQTETDRKTSDERANSMEAKHLTAVRKLEESNLEIESLSKVKEQFESEVVRLSCSNKSLEKEKKHIEQGFKLEISRLNCEKQEALQKLTQGADEITRYTKQLKESEETIDILQAKMTSNVQDLSAAKSQVEVLQEKLKESIQEHDNLKIDLESRLGVATEEVTEVKALLHSKNVTLQELQQQHEMLTEKKEAIQLAQEARIKVLEEDLLDAKEDLEHAETQFNDCKETMSKMKNDLRLGEEKCRRFEATILMLKDANDFLREPPEDGIMVYSDDFDGVEAEIMVTDFRKRRTVDEDDFPFDQARYYAQV